MNEVLTTILQCHQSHLRQIAFFTRTGYSFEEWLNWQACWACSQKGWKISPKPKYKAVGFKRSNNQADLFVEPNPTKKVIIEFGLVHDCTETKWREKLESDRLKLEPPFPDNFEPIQVVYVASKSDVDSWTKWLNNLSFWNQHSVLSEVLHIPSGEFFLMKAWTMQNKC